MSETNEKRKQIVDTLLSGKVTDIFILVNTRRHVIYILITQPEIYPTAFYNSTKKVSLDSLSLEIM